MTNFFKWVFNDRKHRNRIIFSTVLTIVFFVMVWLDPATPFFNTLFLSIISAFYLLNWVMIYKLYIKNK